MIARHGREALPRLPVAAVADALRRLPEEELGLALRSKLLPIVTLPGLRLFAAFGPAARAIAGHDGLRLVAEGQPAEFVAASREALGPALLREATWGLARRFPANSASVRLWGRQRAVLAVFAVAAACAAWLVPVSTLVLALSLFGGLFFLSIIALRLLCLLPAPPAKAPAGADLADDRLPAYSVLVPLFRETSVLGQLLAGLTDLDYPPEKLDIKLILEESDILMQRAVAGLRLPPQFDVITVPCGLPQTKPRALNYALAYARGELLTIFDAEDIPDRGQLRLAASHFAALPPDVACLQARLVFYNSGENWLTRQFTIEYASLFGVILPTLAAHGLPFPLGGTSNHFRTGVLREVGAWDPFNVTEDADLGLRLARAGYRSAAIDSATLEEANTRFPNWLRQRARWLKGFLQTWLVQMRHPLRALSDLGPAAFWATQTMTLGVVASALLHPMCLMAIAWGLVFDPETAAGTGLAATMLAGLNCAVLVSGYAVSMVNGVQGLACLRIRGWHFAIATMPFYWLLMSVAAWLAVWQFIVAPFHWNKTQHGLSRVQRRGAARPAQ